MPDTKEVQALRSEVTNLKAGTLALAEQVSHLSSVLATVNRIRTEQREIKKDVAAVKESSVTTEDLQAEATERQRVHQTIRVRFGFVLVILVGLAVAFVLIGASYVQFRHQSYDVCQARSVQAEKVRTYLSNSQAAALARAHSEAEKQAIRTSISQLLAAFPKVDCDGLR
jgi:Tfp pilus assembly protein PilO